MDSVTVPFELMILLVLLGAIIVMWDLFERKIRDLTSTTGIKPKSKVIALRNSDELPSGELYSKDLGLRGRPDALVEEDGFIIPVNFLPTAKKIQDRHVIRLLVHLRLIEATKGKRPPYGTLLIGSDRRPVKIQNTDQKQEWLDNILKEMREIEEDLRLPIADPGKYKCKHCDVRGLCAFSAYTDD